MSGCLHSNPSTTALFPYFGFDLLEKLRPLTGQPHVAHSQKEIWTLQAWSAIYYPPWYPEVVALSASCLSWNQHTSQAQALQRFVHNASMYHHIQSWEGWSCWTLTQTLQGWALQVGKNPHSSTPRCLVFNEDPVYQLGDSIFWPNMVYLQGLLQPLSLHEGDFNFHACL